MKMVNDLGFEQIAVPLTVDCEDCPRSSIFATKGCLSCDSLLLLIPSSGTMPGIWSRSLCIEKGLQVGTMLPFFVKAAQLGIGVIVFNPNVNSVRIPSPTGGVTKCPIPHNETPDQHVLYFLDSHPHVDRCGTGSYPGRQRPISSSWPTVKAARKRRI